MTALAVIMFIVLGAIAAVHLAWAFGVHWPARSERELVALAVGRKGQTRMPTPLQCIAAATAIFVAGLWALGLAGLKALPFEPDVIRIAGVAIVIIFALRGVATYLPGWRRRFDQEPFATMDRNWYGPLCLLFAVMFAVLVINRFGA